MAPRQEPDRSLPIAGRFPDSQPPSTRLADMRAQMRRGCLLTVDSPLVVTARELAMRHMAPVGTACPACGDKAPCPARLNAEQVCEAAGMAVPILAARRDTRPRAA